ncbi:MAG: tetratricopeptide repeat protein [Candidatus Coatesbacteria bacterium]|nr:MAG: tetratricopeptide repeat protein [Candidatus Coatesbacteria bacterium]
MKRILILAVSVFTVSALTAGALSEAEELNEQGLDYFYEGKYDEALECFEKALELDPEYAAAWDGKGRAFNYQQRYNEAMWSFEKALEYDPDMIDVWVHKSSVRNAQGYYEEALEYLEKVLADDPDHVHALTNKGWSYLGLERFDEALAQVDKGLELDPEFVYAYVIKAWTLLNLGRPAEASENFDNAIDLDVLPPAELTGVWFGKSAALTAMGDFEGAMGLYDKILVQNPEIAVAWYNRACLKSLSGRKDEMLTDLAQAIDMAPELAASAQTDADFEAYYDDPDFLELVKPAE